MIRPLSIAPQSLIRLAGFAVLVVVFLLAAEGRPELGRVNEPAPSEKVFEVAEAALPGSQTERKRVHKKVEVTESGQTIKSKTLSFKSSGFVHPLSRVIHFRKLLI